MTTKYKGHWYEAGSIAIHSGTDMAFSVTVTDASFSSPSVSASRCYDVTDETDITEVGGTVLSGSASISTTTWTTPILQPAGAHKEYRIETDISDSSNTVTLVLYVEVQY